jgi:serine/threonine-protein kinase RsbW
MGKKFSEKGVPSNSTTNLPRKRDPVVFFVSSNRSYLQDTLTHCADNPDKYTVHDSIEDLTKALSSGDGRLPLAFVFVVEPSCDKIDVPALRQVKLDYPQVNYVLMLGKCDQPSHLRFQSLGIQNTIMEPFDDVSLKSEIATALPNVPQFKRHPDLMKRGMVRFDFLIPSDLAYVLGINYMISMLLKEFAFPPTDCRINVPLACDEALTNAIIHGNKSEADKKVSVHIYVSSSRFKMRVKDQGAGFDVDKVADPLEGENVMRSSGRGIYLMRSIMDSVKYKEGGRVVELEKVNTSGGPGGGERKS